MMCGITGTPGTGKSMIGDELSRRGHRVVHLTSTVGPYVVGEDEERDAQIIDTDRWVAEFVPVDGFVEGHIAHLLPCDRIVVLRCRPDELRKRLAQRKYREKIYSDYKYLETRGLSAQLLTSKPDINPALKSLPLESVYFELGLIPLRTERQRDAEWEEMLQADESRRLLIEQRQQQKRLSDVLDGSPRLVIVGKPGSGKTVSLKFIALMLARGQVGASRLRLDIPYIPVYVRLPQYAEKLKTDSGLALEKFLMNSIGDYHDPGAVNFNEFLQLVLDQGLCAVLLDGLDEVGDVGDTLIKGRTLRNAVLSEVQRFSRQRCRTDCPNRIIVTSRLEGYRHGDLQDFDEMELSALAIPDEVKEFLLRWFAAHEQKNNPDLSLEALYSSSQASVDPLMADIMRSDSVQRLAINPLLLTILAMIHKLGTRLPNERVTLYQIVTKTMVESWRQAQTRHDILIYDVLSASRVLPMMASLAFWVHENQPGGVMPEVEWRRQIKRLLQEKDDELKDERADEISEMFMRHAREEVGLLIERSPGQVGFFHLTLEEYLAGVAIAARSEKDRREIVQKHWTNPRWREVIRLAAGQLMLNASGESDVLDQFVIVLRHLEEGNNPELLGMPAFLAGSAIADVGAEHFNRKVVRETRTELVELSRSWHLPPPRRADFADISDELGYVPDDLYDFIQIPGRDSIPACYMAKYPVTNLQYARFLKEENFHNEKLWQDFPAYDEKLAPMKKGYWDKEVQGWLRNNLKDGKMIEPRYWHDPRLGASRRSAPVVGITWYEANAYCKWLAENWQTQPEAQSLSTFNLQPSSLIFRLPTENEWVTAAGGEEGDRFAWGKLEKKEDVVRFANTYESGINRTTPVWMYPQGASPLGIMDMSGNVWEWQANFREVKDNWLALRGGSWYLSVDLARLANRHFDPPYGHWYYFGFRVVVVSPPI